MATSSKIASGNPPRVSCAPRIEGTGTSLRVVFRKMSDLRKCLEDQTLVLEVTVNVPKDFAEAGRLGIVLQGRYSDHAPGAIYVALQGSTLMESQGSLTYDLLQANARNYKALEEAGADTQECWTAILRYVAEHLSTVRNTYFPDYSESLHTPVKLKMKKPAGASYKKISKEEGVEENSKEFNIVEHVQSAGKLLIRLGAPWLMKQQPIQNIMLGLTTSLARWKYLTDDEKADLVKRNAEKKRLEEVALENKRKREEKRAIAASTESASASAASEPTPAKKSRAAAAAAVVVEAAEEESDNED